MATPEVLGFELVGFKSPRSHHLVVDKHLTIHIITNMNEIIKYLEDRLIPNNGFEKIGSNSFLYRDKIDTIYVFVDSLNEVTIIHDGDNVVSNQTTLNFYTYDHEEIYQTILSRF